MTRFGTAPRGHRLARTMRRPRPALTGMLALLLLGIAPGCGESSGGSSGLFIVVGEQPVMEAILVTRLESGELSRTSLFETVIPPLINAPVESPFEF